MKQKERDRIHSIISLFLLIFWCLLIFSFSNQVGSVSEASSDRVIEILNKIFQLLHLRLNAYSFPYISFIVRKLAHMFLYFVLYLLSFYVSTSYKINKKYFISFIFCFLYAFSDEFHQLFIQERSFGLLDVGIDMIGSTIAFFLLKFLKK